MRKKITSLVLALAMTFGCVPAATVSAARVENNTMGNEMEGIQLYANNTVGTAKNINVN